MVKKNMKEGQKGAEKNQRKNIRILHATNQTEIYLDSFIPMYKCRWGIETGFRVQDEAHIMSHWASVKDSK
jgi:hypothetical protein